MIFHISERPRRIWSRDCTSRTTVIIPPRSTAARILAAVRASWRVCPEISFSRPLSAFLPKFPCNSIIQISQYIFTRRRSARFNHRLRLSASLPRRPSRLLLACPPSILHALVGLCLCVWPPLDRLPPSPPRAPSIYHTVRKGRTHGREERGKGLHCESNSVAPPNQESVLMKTLTYLKLTFKRLSHPGYSLR